MQIPHEEIYRDSTGACPEGVRLQVEVRDGGICILLFPANNSAKPQAFHGAILSIDQMGVLIPNLQEAYRIAQERHQQ
jgi:hypothetical protein